MKAELLAPAGSFESMVAAVGAGADAVYMGGSLFGARAYADNLDTEKMKEALDFCHLHGVKLYMTVNTLLKEEELKTLYDFLAPIYEHGLDAAIVQDFGVLRYLKRQFPKLDLHASTQMTNQGADGAKLLESLGVTRVVTSRELTLPEIRKIHEETDLEIESFVHGALCYCYSGQCLLSSVIGGRSGNRGRCAQPCRLPYQFSGNQKKAGAYLLSPKDICTLNILPKVLEAGVYSLKIEGRMKRPEYTAGVTRIYRKYLDLYEKKGKKGYRVGECDLQELMDLYNRGGFSEGYFETKGNARMMSTLRPNHYGTEGARVLSVKKNLITASAMEELHKGDVLESATMNVDIPKGMTFTIKAGRDMMAVPGTVLHRTQNAVLLKELAAYQDFDFRKEKINGKLRISLGKPVILSLSCGEFSVTVSGPVVEAAKSMGLTKENVERQMRKTGNTGFCFDRLEISLEENCFLPVQVLKELRREGIDRIIKGITASYHRESVNRLEPAQFPGEDIPQRAQSYQTEGFLSDSAEKAAEITAYASKPEKAMEGTALAPMPEKAAEVTAYASKPEKAMEITALAFTLEQAEALLSVPGITRIYLEAHTLLDYPERFLTVREQMKNCNIPCFLAMPPLFREEQKRFFEEEKIREILFCLDGFLVRNLEALVFLKERGFQVPLIADANLYSYNQESRVFLREQGFSGDTAPLELNERELSLRGMEGSELLVYGRISLMVSSQCVKRTSGSCNHKKEFTVLTDRKGKEFPLWNDCDVCCNILYNTAPHSLLDSEREIRTLGPKSLRLAFTVETPKETRRVAEAFTDRFLYGKAASLTLSDFTRGHFKRGVE